MTAKVDKYDPGSLPDLLPLYYKKLFPYGLYFRWLNYGGVPKTYFSNREFSFTLKDDVYIRYQSFTDQQDMEKEIQKICPYKIDVGAVFTHRPKDHKTINAAAFVAQEKELVFDIDMTDYDDVRSCCSGADICEKCWPLMSMAVKILNRALKDDFGFEHILWVYSGRRGIHCWVCDEVTRKLSQAGRTSIAEYLTVVKGGENQVRKVHLDQYIHPSIKAAIEIISNNFQDYAVDKQDFLGDKQKWTKVLSLIPSQDIQKEVAEELELLPDSASRWKKVKKFIELSSKSGFTDSWQADKEIMLQYCYPRLDVNVSKGINHLLKSPFCVHPKTGRVCVPFDPDDVDRFSPAEVPTVSQLLDELNKVEAVDLGGVSKHTKDYKHTSMAASIEVFEQFVKKLEKSWRGKLIEESDKKMEF